MGKLMVQSSTKVLFIFLVTFAITIPCLEAGIGEFDDYLKAQAEEAHKYVLDSYIPIHRHHKHHVHVHLLMEEAKNTKGIELKQKYEGKHKPCEETIDNCWRCKANWAKNLYKLAKCGKAVAK